METDINDALKLTADEAEALSPMHGDNFKKIHANARRITRFVIIIAENDSPAFHDQSSKFFEMLKATGVNTEYIEIKDTDHFGEFIKFLFSNTSLLLWTNAEDLSSKQNPVALIF